MLDQVNLRWRQRARRGFTLIEAVVTVAILGVITALTAPSAIDWIMIQRVKAAASEMVTDIRFARGESIKRNQRVVIAFRSLPGDQTCYAIHTYGTLGVARECNCTQGAGFSCDRANDPNNPLFLNWMVELKTVTAPASNKVDIAASRTATFLAPNGFPDPALAGVFQVNFDGQNNRLLRVVTNAAGRPQVCAPVGSRILGYPACA